MTPSVTLVNDGNIVDGVSHYATEAKGDSEKSSVMHRSLYQEPLHVISAKGNYLHLSNGQKIFDATGGAAVSCLGHGDER